MRPWQITRVLPSISDGAITQAHVDAARVRWEAAHEAVRKLCDPSAPGYRNFVSTSPVLQRQIAEAERIERLTRTEYQMFADRFEAQERRARSAREEDLYRRSVQATETAAAEAARQTALAIRRAPAALQSPTNEGVTMTDEAEAIRKREALRLAMLQYFCKRSKGQARFRMDFATAYSDLGVERAEGQPAMKWLVDAGLLAYAGAGGVALTPEGVSEAESSLGGQAARHFAPTLIQYVNTQTFNGAVGAVQTGPDAVATFQQQNNAAQAPELARLFAELRAKTAELPEEQQADAVELVTDLEEQAMRAKPNAMKLKALETGLVAMKTFGPTIATIVSTIIANAQQ